MTRRGSGVVDQRRQRPELLGNGLEHSNHFVFLRRIGLDGLYGLRLFFHRLCMRPHARCIGLDGAKPITIQLPEVSVAKLESRVELAKDQTALFALVTESGSYVLALIRTTITPAKDK